MTERAAGLEGVHMMKLCENEVRIVDALFHEMAKRNNGGRGLSAEDVIDGSWLLFERGCLRLVDDGKHMGIEPCDGNRAERRAQAKQNRPLVEFKRQMDRARENAS
jgi:hypothetical protein